MEWLVDRDHDEHLVMGYKPAGHGNGPIEGKKDGFEGLMECRSPFLFANRETNISKALRASHLQDCGWRFISWSRSHCVPINTIEAGYVDF
ncbi:hypothetical protein CH35J_012756 [Colletotrichum higginsianum]|uniref:Uncharacterized protein n=1 Tax=Colletotrichum higginsianum TaxID=80884 RepID=A0A4T0VCA9_9PEZI|nr:hypothetical protein CH35J_012756 [Colletotrichum higginsianum]